MRDDAEPAPVDPAWRSQLLIGITVLNWLHKDESDRQDLAELANQLATPGQRGLRLHQRWAERDRAALDNPDVNARHTRATMASRGCYTGLPPRRSSRLANWDLDVTVHDSSRP